MSDEGKEWYIEAPWGRIALIAWGDCLSYPVLLCHGRLDSAATFIPLTKLLPTHFYYIALDLPGCGKSDWMPQGLPLSVLDLTYAIRVVVEHFRWKEFAYIGHSLGALIGMHYAAAHHGRITHAVFLDPTPAYQIFEPEDFGRWYQMYIGDLFSEEGYNKIVCASRETAPRYTREQILQMMCSKRTIPKEAAEVIIDRIIEPAGDGLYRFTYDQRQKMVIRLPRSAEHMERLYTSTTKRTLTIVSRTSVDRGSYDLAQFIFRVDKYPRGNYAVHIVEGGHDVHLTHPERMAPLVSRFLASVSSKL